MTNRKGAGRGTGKGYKNLRSFPRDASIHSQSAKGRKQPQRIQRVLFPIKPVEYGFDLTDFDTAENFEKVLVDNNIPLKFKKITRGEGDTSYNVFEWKNEDVTIHTGNNPITGEFSTPQLRQSEKGYASYIGIKGKPIAVKKLTDSIKKQASYVKGQDKTCAFIW